jgi:tetratricopeptide (TPR) repeat protein
MTPLHGHHSSLLVIAVWLALQQQTPQEDRSVAARREHQLGIQAFRESTPEGYARAIQHFRAATQLDPSDCQYALRLAEANLFLALEQAAARDDFSDAARAGATPNCAANSVAEARLQALRSLQDVELGTLSLGSVRASRAALDADRADALNWYIDWKVKPDQDNQILRAVELDPGLPMVQYELGQYWLALSDLSKAKAAFTRALELNPRHFRSYLGLAEATKRLDPTQNVTDLYLKAIDVAPDFWQAHIQLGDYYVYLAENDLASKEYRIAARIHSGLQLPWLKIASNALETDDFDVVERSALTVLFLHNLA